MKKKWIIISLVAVVAILIIAACICGILVASPETQDGTPRPTRTPRPTQTPRPTKTPESTATPAPLAPAFSEIAKNAVDMTEVQWKAYSDSIEGSRVEGWEGWVSNVDKEWLGSRYVLYIDLDPPDTLFSTFDVMVYVPEEMAATYNKGERLRVSGYIDRVSEFLTSLSIQLEDATVEVLPD